MHANLSLYINRFQPFPNAYSGVDANAATGPDDPLSGRIHLWWADLGLPDAHSVCLAAALSPEEKKRAERLRGTRQRRFIAAHGMLRMLLARYLGLEPITVPIGRDAKGKPRLSYQRNATEINFSLSHSGEMGLFGFCADHAIGVDIEQIRPMDTMDAIARRFFAEPEYAALSRAEPSLKPALFFRIWTMKEALVKATGEGIGGLKQIKPIKIPGNRPAGDHLDWQYVADHSGRPRMLRPLDVTPGYAAAVAVADAMADPP